MGTNDPPGIVNVERLSDGILIEFDDGRSALFPTPLLLSVLAQATEIWPSETDEGSTTRQT
jgi:hypothetical protein